MHLNPATTRSGPRTSALQHPHSHLHIRPHSQLPRPQRRRRRPTLLARIRTTLTTPTQLPNPLATLPLTKFSSGPPLNSNGTHSAAEYQNSPKPLTGYAARQPFTETCPIETSCSNTRAAAPTLSTSTTAYSATSRVAYHHGQLTSAPCPRSYDVTTSICRRQSPTSEPPEPTF